MEQIENDYDSSGNLISTITRQRFDDATGTGELRDADTQPTARVSYVANYPDSLGRTQAVANYGINNGSWSRSITIPARSGISPQPEVTSYEYNSVNYLANETNPAGVVTRRTWDQGGRLTGFIENWLETPSVDTRTSNFEYTPDGWMKKFISWNPNSSVSGKQITEWIYGVGPAQGSALYSRRLVYQKVMPSESGVANRITYTYNRQFQLVGKSDQLGTIHVYTFDKLGRMTADAVASWGEGVDNTVGKLSIGYDARGLISRASSHNAGGISVLNEVAWDYNGFNQRVAEYQEHSGAVNKATSLKVGYTFEPGYNNTTRSTGIKYPHVGAGSAPVVEWNYATEEADALSRVSSIQQSGSVLSDWRYVGLGMVVAQTYPAASNTALSYGSSSTTAVNAYKGYDRFGRIVETIWKKGSTELVHSKYARNAVGGVIWRQDLKASSILSPTTQDNYYWYDDLQQVTRHDRGQLTPGSPPYTGVTNLQQEEDLTYDETGNWKAYQSYSPSLVQMREHNVADQITEITNPSGVAQPSYDPVGNMREMPAPSDWSKAYTCKWDAWNRLVQIRDGGTTVADYTYDARTRRIRKATSTETRSYYYDKKWRCLEERVSGIVKADYVYNPYDRWNLIRRRLASSSSFDQTLFVLRDNLDPVAIVSTAGVVDERYGYDTYGPVRIMDANFGARTSSVRGWTWLFHGEFQDSESGLYNYGYRYYHPNLGRWLGRDPIGELGGLNLYQFAGGDPVNRQDRLGLQNFQPDPTPGPLDPPSIPDDYDQRNQEYDSPNVDWDHDGYNNEIDDDPVDPNVPTEVPDFLDDSPPPFVPPTEPGQSGYNGDETDQKYCKDGYVLERTCRNKCAEESAKKRADRDDQHMEAMMGCNALIHPAAILACIASYQPQYIGDIRRINRDFEECAKKCPCVCPETGAPQP